jgi:hypothetical protein
MYSIRVFRINFLPAFMFILPICLSVCNVYSFDSLNVAPRPKVQLINGFNQKKDHRPLARDGSSSLRSLPLFLLLVPPWE